MSGPDRNELLLHKVTQSCDLKQLVNIILKYALGSSFKTKSHTWEGKKSLALTNGSQICL